MQQVTKKPIYHALALAALLAALTAVVSLSMARAKEPLAQTNSGPGPCTECDCDGYVRGWPPERCQRDSCNHQYEAHKFY